MSNINNIKILGLGLAAVLGVFLISLAAIQSLELNIVIRNPFGEPFAVGVGGKDTGINSIGDSGGNGDGDGSDYGSSGVGKGLERWNIDDRKYSYDELRSKYNALYNFTYSYLVKEDIRARVIPKGVPEIYGEELNVSYDADPNRMIPILMRYENETLNEEQMARYVSIGSNISCEYCCGAKTLVFSDGRRACGCAHSYAMRGLAKYLLLNHPTEYTDEEILKELGKWKATYFPKQTMRKGYQEYVETYKVDPSILEGMPDMVGRC